MEYVQGKELKEFMESQSNKMKTNIRMRVTPEQSRKVQEICFDNGIAWQNLKNNIGHVNKSLLLIDDIITFTLNEEIFRKHAYQQIDADLFIRTNGTCEEDIITLTDSAYSNSDTAIRRDKFLMDHKEIDFEQTQYAINNLTIAILEQKLKKKNEILKKARIKRKNQREELHKLNLKLQKCISFEEHHQVVDELKKDINFRKETIKNTFQIGKDRLKEIEQLKVKNTEMGKLVNLNKGALDLAVITKELAMNEIERKNKEIENLKAIIEYLERKVK